MKRQTERSTKHWFSIYQLVERYLEEQRRDGTDIMKEMMLQMLTVDFVIRA